MDRSRHTRFVFALNDAGCPVARVVHVTGHETAIDHDALRALIGPDASDALTPVLMALHAVAEESAIARMKAALAEMEV